MLITLHDILKHCYQAMQFLTSRQVNVDAEIINEIQMCFIFYKYFFILTKMASPLNFGGIMGGREKALMEKVQMIWCKLFVPPNGI